MTKNTSDDDALIALDIVEKFASALNFKTERGIREYLKAERETRILLNQSRLSPSVRLAVDRVTNVVTESYITAVELLDEKSRLGGEQTRRRLAKYFVGFLYLSCVVVVFWKGDWKLIGACFPISILEYLTLIEAYVLRICAKILTYVLSGKESDGGTRANDVKKTRRRK